MSSTPAGATFAWTVTESGSSGASAGSGSSINQTLSATGAAVGTTTYTVTPTLAGCPGLPVDFIATINPLPVVISTPASQAICTGATTGITLTSNPAGATFTWTANAVGVNGATNGSGSSLAQTLTSTSGGNVTYTITPSLNGCVGPTSDVVITVNPNPTLIADPTLPSICVGSSVVLSVSGASSYVWSPATGLSATTGSSVTATPPATQPYAITGTDVNGCVSTTNVIVTVNPIPVVTVTPDVTICAGTPTTLQASGAGSYEWTPATGLSSTTGASVVANPATTTTYTVEGTSLNCTSTATVTVTVIPVPVVNAGPDISICEGESVTLTASGAVNYSWDGGVQNGVPFTPTTTTTYTVYGIAANTCSSSDQVTVTVSPAPEIVVVPSVTTGCSPLTVNFQNNTTGGTTYNWTFGDGGVSSQTNPTYTYTDDGCFDVSLTATTAGGCSVTSTYTSLICAEPTPIASFVASPSVVDISNPFTQMINTSENAISYNWSFGDGTPTTTEFSPSHLYPSDILSNYTITLVAYGQTGCTDTARVIIQMTEDVLYFVPNSFTPDGDDYNQTFKPVFTTGFDPYAYGLYIFDRWGEMIFESHDASVGWSGTYGVGNEIVQDGTYVWVIEFKATQSGQRKKINGHVNVLR